jgi:hypothetical protein
VYGYAARHRSRESVAVVLQTMALPVLVRPVAPATEQNAPGVTVAFEAAVVVAFVAAVVFGAAVVVLAVVAALVVGATGAVVAGAAVVAGTLVEAGVAGAVVAGLVVVALVVTAALVGRAGELTLALANLGICGLGVDVSGFAIAPTAPRLKTPPATTPILTFPLSAFHCPARRVVSLVVGIRYGRRGWCGQFMLGGCDMGLLRGGALGNISRPPRVAVRRSPIEPKSASRCRRPSRQGRLRVSIVLRHPRIYAADVSPTATTSSS